MKNEEFSTAREQKREEEFKFDALQGIVCMSWFYAVVALIVIVIVALTSCTTTRYVTVPEYHYDYHHSVDTVRERDSTIVEKETIIREADSALLAKMGIELANGQRAILVLKKELEKIVSEKQEAIHDTIIKSDSIRVPYPIEKKLTRWQSFCCDYGKVMLGCSIVAVILALLWLLRWIRRVKMKV